MKKSLGILVVLVIILIGAGIITSGILGSPALHQTDDVAGSVFSATPEQATQIFIFVGIVISNVLILGLVVMGVFWLINRAYVRGQTSEGDDAETATAATE